MKKPIFTNKAPAAIGPYSQAVQWGDVVFISGQIPLNPETGVLVDGSLTESTHQVMKNIGSLLNEANLSFDDIVKCTIFLKDLENFNEVNKIYATYFRSTPPARETVEVSKLPMDVEIEISCIAVQD